MHRQLKRLRSRKEAILHREALAGGGRDVAGRRAFNAALDVHRLRGGEKRKREEEEEEETPPVCGICLEPLTANTTIVTPCDRDHSFCKACLETWFDHRCCSCPLATSMPCSIASTKTADQ
mgnify:CR=1 FL=1